MYGTTPVGTEPGWLWPVSPVSVIWLATTAWYPFGGRTGAAANDRWAPLAVAGHGGCRGAGDGHAERHEDGRGGDGESWRASLREAAFAVRSSCGLRMIGPFSVSPAAATSLSGPRMLANPDGVIDALNAGRSTLPTALA